MKKRKSTGGYILPVTLLLLSCTLLWGSILLLALSDQYEASNELVQREQSRLLAYSGWNLALNQLKQEGKAESMMLQQEIGTTEVSVAYKDTNLITIQSSALAGDYPKQVQGTVRLLELPWREISDWVLVESLQNVQQPSIFCSDANLVVLTESFTQPLVISSLDNQPVIVIVSDPISCDTLYVQGNLEVEAALQAEAIYVSGSITGTAFIDCQLIEQQYMTEPTYQLQVVERVF